MNCDRGGGPPVIIANLYSFQAIALFELDERPHYVCKGGQIIAEGPPEKVAKAKGSYTGKFLKLELAA